MSVESTKLLCALVIWRSWTIEKIRMFDRDSQEAVRRARNDFRDRGHRAPDDEWPEQTYQPLEPEQSQYRGPLQSKAMSNGERLDEGMTMAQVGEAIGRSPERVRQIEAGALLKLSKSLCVDGRPNPLFDWKR